MSDGRWCLEYSSADLSASPDSNMSTVGISSARAAAESPRAIASLNAAAAADAVCSTGGALPVPSARATLPDAAKVNGAIAAPNSSAPKRSGSPVLSCLRMIVLSSTLFALTQCRKPVGTIPGHRMYEKTVIRSGEALHPYIHLGEQTAHERTGPFPLVEARGVNLVRSSIVKFIATVSGAGSLGPPARCAALPDCCADAILLDHH